MTQQKKSFFEKLTGIKRVNENNEEEFVINAEGTSITENTDSPNNNQTFAPTSFEINDEAYELPSQPTYEENMERQPAGSGQVTAPTATEEQTERTTPEPENDDPEGQLTIDVYQTDDEVVIKSTIAGVKPEDLDVSINNDMITIRGERKQDEEISPENYYYQECYWGPFSRSVILPVEIVADKAEAIMKNGILTLKLPKADTTKTRKIQVRGF
jgi:HSP20 family protein